MRLICLTVIALTTASPAFAGTDAGDAPNPFTEPSAGQTTTSGADGAGIVQSPAAPVAEGGDASGQPTGQNNEAGSSSSFYQQQKKDGDGH